MYEIYVYIYIYIFIYIYIYVYILHAYIQCTNSYYTYIYFAYIYMTSLYVHILHIYNVHIHMHTYANHTLYTPHIYNLHIHMHKLICICICTYIYSTGLTGQWRFSVNALLLRRFQRTCISLHTSAMDRSYIVATLPECGNDLTMLSSTWVTSEWSPLGLPIVQIPSVRVEKYYEAVRNHRPCQPGDKKYAFREIFKSS